MRVGSSPSRQHVYTGGGPPEGLGLFWLPLLATISTIAARTLSTAVALAPTALSFAQTRYAAQTATGESQTQLMLAQQQARAEAAAQAASLQAQQLQLERARLDAQRAAAVPGWMLPVVAAGGVVTLVLLLKPRRR